jgi:hypothetical protein
LAQRSAAGSIDRESAKGDQLLAKCFFPARAALLCWRQRTLPRLKAKTKYEPEFKSQKYAGG